MKQTGGSKRREISQTICLGLDNTRFRHKKRVIVVVWRLHDYSKIVTPKGDYVIIT